MEGQWEGAKDLQRSLAIHVDVANAEPQFRSSHILQSRDAIVLILFVVVVGDGVIVIVICCKELKQASPASKILSVVMFELVQG